MRNLSHPSARLMLAAFGLLGVTFMGSVRATTSAPSTQPSTAAAETVTAPPVPTAAPPEMNLEQFMQVPVTTNTLTLTPRQLVPAAVTSIDRAEIDAANARTLTDLLSAYVPNFEWDSDNNEEDHYGVRGIIGGQDDDYLLLVNGREMNQLTHFGALTERDLMLTGDLNEVDMVRGAGSAVYGPGALLGTLSLTTYNGLTFQGAQVTGRVDEINQAYSGEFKLGEKLGADTGWFVYGGVAQVVGADSTYAPIIGGQNWLSTTYGPVTAGKAIPANFDREDAEYNGTPQIKAHLQWDGDGVTVWARYTRGGYMLNDTSRGSYAPFPTGFTDQYPPSSAIGYEQLTGYAGITKPLMADLTLDAYTSFDVTDYERELAGNLIDSNQEQKLISQAKVDWTGLPNNDAALAVQFGYYWMGDATWMTPGANGLDSLLATPQRWQSNMVSVTAEDQWHITKTLTLFLNGGAAKDRFTAWMISQREALVWQVDHKDTAKVVFADSVQTPEEEQMYAQWAYTRNPSVPQKMRSLELRLERQETPNWLAGLSVYYNKLHVLGWDAADNQTLDFGSYKTAGIEIETTYRTPADTITASYGYTKLIGDQLSANTGPMVTAALYGYGYDLANWAANVGKITWNHRLSSKLSTNATFEFLWGFNGDLDVQNYLNANPFFGPGTPASTVPGYNKPYSPTALLNLGISYQITESQMLRFDAYNVLGWINQTLNKEEVYNPTWAGVYRVNAPAFGVTYRYTF
jgi:TonB-dependent Receptor Plug Domain